MLALGTALVTMLSPAHAQERPNEEDLFGAPPEPPSVVEPTPIAPEDALVLPAPTQLKEASEPLAIGGTLYLRSVLSATQDDSIGSTALSLPNLMDAYFDTRPNDRVRGMLLARMQYDPTLDPNRPARLGANLSREPRVALDQLWVSFDVLRTVFVTAGKQHVKWGTAHFWSPTDYLHPVRRNPLDVFDVRTGTTMLKLHVPWEKQGWNFYGLALFDIGRPANELGKIGAALRAEMVLGPAELGVDAVLQRGRRARYGVDLSTSLGSFDFYADIALKSGSDLPLWKNMFEQRSAPDFSPAATVGASRDFKYSAEDYLTIGTEYFYNSIGYTDRDIYPWLLYTQSFAPFYVARHYAGLYVLVPNPGSWNNTTFIFSALGNLSDRSYISRLDYQVLVLTYLRVEAYAAAHFGTKGGEFRFGFDVPAELAGSLPHGTPAHVAAPVLDLGLAVRVSL